jgi:hypothetical protein
MLAAARHDIEAYETGQKFEAQIKANISDSFRKKLFLMTSSEALPMRLTSESFPNLNRVRAVENPFRRNFL